METLTDQVEAGAREYFRRIEDVGGVIPALKSGFFQHEIAEASYLYQLEEDRKERITVGVNQYANDDPLQISLLRVDSEGEVRQIQELQRVRRRRDSRDVSVKLRALA